MKTGEYGIVLVLCKYHLEHVQSVYEQEAVESQMYSWKINGKNSYISFVSVYYQLLPRTTVPYLPKSQLNEQGLPCNAIVFTLLLFHLLQHIRSHIENAICWLFTGCALALCSSIMLQSALFTEVVLAARDHRILHICPRPSAYVAGKGQIVLILLALMLLIDTLPLGLLEALLPCIPFLQ